MGAKYSSIFDVVRWSTKLLLGTHTIWLSKQQNSIKAITTENGEDELIFKPAKLYFWDELLVSELCHHETNKVISPFFSQWDKLKNKWGSVGIIRGLWTKSPGVLKLSSTTSTTSLSAPPPLTTEKRWDTKFSRKDLDLDDETFSKNSTWVVGT